MAHDSPEAWDTYCKVSADISSIVDGPPGFDPSTAVHDLDRRPDVTLEGTLMRRQSREVFLTGTIGVPLEETAEEVAWPDVIAARIASDALGISSGKPNLRYRHLETSISGTHVKTEQVVQNLPIVGSDVTLHLDRSGQAYALTGRAFPEALRIQLAQTQVTRSKPADIAINYLGLPKGADCTLLREEEVAVLIGREFQRCWRLSIVSQNPFGDWTVLIRLSGDPVAAFNIASSARGVASAFPINPFRGGPQRCRLDNLSQSGATDLTGKFTKVGSATGVNAQGTHGLFHYLVTDLKFDEPNLYHCLEHARRAFAALSDSHSASNFLATPNFNPMRASVHDPNVPNNAYYAPSTGELYFGDINIDPTTRWTSRSRDIVLHEFAHAVSDAICQLGRTTPHQQSRAMSEGFSDYFAAAFLNQPVIGDYFTNNANGFRTCANHKKFPKGYAGEEHDVGEVWAAYLWSLRNDPAVGDDITDVLALESLYFLGPFQTILQGVNALVLADRKNFPTDSSSTKGLHEDKINQLFAQRKP